MSDEIRIVEVHKRKCGWPREGGLYMVTDDGTPGGVLARVVVIDPPVPVLRKPHRGPVLVDGSKILARMPEDSWLVGASAETLERKQADGVWDGIFGMPLHERLQFGNCAGIKDPETAYETLLATVMWDKRVADYLHNLAENGAHNLPGAAEHYNRLTIALRRYARSRGEEPQALVEAAAACWSWFRATRKNKYNDLLPLAFILTVVGLVADGREMMTRIHQA